ncbi:hypothetical protein H0H93_012834, partial [Arthromyces matolae]
LGHDNSLTSKTDLPSAKKDEIRDELKLDADARLAKIYIKKREFIIARIQPPGSTSPIGRSTRCYKAYCLETNRVVLLKDTWRVVSDSLRPEHEIYTTLHENEVPHILEVITAGDVGRDKDPHHTTQTKAWVSKTRQKLLNILDLQHYRIALEYVPFCVDQFEDVRQPIMAIRDAARAHGIAATVAKVLHRDISVGNIMFKIDENGNVFGYLIDWDLSLDLSQATLEAQLERTGTWQFTAARLLERPRNNEPLIHNRIDDVESFFHLTNWLALRYTPHSLDGSELAQALRENFEDSYVHLGTGRTHISSHKRKNMISGDLVLGPRFTNEGIATVLRSMQKRLSHRYAMHLSVMPRNPTAQKEYLQDQEALKEALRPLDDPRWLPDLLTDYLDDSDIDWESN